MKVEINILNVKDGDAIIVELLKQNDVLIMVIDGGEEWYYETKLKPKLDIRKKHLMLSFVLIMIVTILVGLFH
jgi:hypothetical protein